MGRGAVFLALAVLLGLTGCQAGAAAPDPSPSSLTVLPAQPTPFPAEAAAPYAAVLERDVSQVVPAAGDRTMPQFSRDLDWEYTLIDVSGDGEPELFVRLADAGQHAIARLFHAEDGAVRCWYCQEGEMNYLWEPLSDGSILTTYDYGGCMMYNIYVLDETGRQAEQPVESLAHRYETYVPEHDVFWSYNDEEIDEESYEELLQEVVESRRIQAWTPLP